MALFSGLEEQIHPNSQMEVICNPNRCQSTLYLLQVHGQSNQEKDLQYIY